MKYLNTIHIHFLGILSLLIFCTTLGYSQIWQEDFSTYADGSTTGVDNRAPTGIDWTRDITGATTIPPGHFEIQGQQFEAYDTNGEVIWTSESIDISGSNRIYVTIDVESEFANDDDTLRTYYKLDGGAETLFGTLIGSAAANETFGAYALSGSTIEIIVKVDTDDDPFFGFFNDYLRFDNVTITQQTEVFSIASANWDAVGTWSISSGGPSCGCTPAASDFAYIESPDAVNFNGTNQIAGVDIANGATLRWTANAELDFIGGSLNVASGGTIDPNGNNADIVLSSPGLYSIANDGSLAIRDIIFRNDNLILNSTGSSTINLTRDLFIDATTGFFSIPYTGIVLNNSGTINVGGDIDVNTGAFGSIGNIEVNNSGIFDLDGEFVNFDANSSIKNLNGATFTFAGATHSAALVLDCDIDGANEFIYDAAGAQDIITTNEYYNLTLAGTGNKTLLGDIQINGNFDVSSNQNLVTGTNGVTFGGDVDNGIQVILGGGFGTTVNFYDLTINNTSGAVPGVRFSNINGGGVSNVLTLTSGIVDVESAFVGFAFAAGSSVTGGIGGQANSFIDGPVFKDGTTDFVFPTGDINGGVGKWARIAISNLSGSEIFAARYNESVYSDVTVASGLDHVSGYEHWELTRSTTQTADVTLYWEDGSASGSDITDIVSSDLVVASYDGSDWVSEGVGLPINGSPAAGDITSIGNASNYSVFTFGSLTGINPLPIELLSFTAKQLSEAVLLDWKVATEINNDFYTLERSYDGSEFLELAIIQGAGNSTSTTEYAYEDYPPFSGLVYYRLTQTDFDGTSETFDLVVVNYDKNSSKMEVYPNPAIDGTVNIVLPTKIDNNVLLRVFSVAGDKLLEKNFRSIEGRIEVDISALGGKGVYIITANSRDGNYQTRLVVE